MTELQTPPAPADLLRERLAARLARARAAGAPRIPRRPDPGAPVPLSPVQARMWFAGQFEPGSPAYNVPVLLRLTGPLDLPALQGALRDLLERHEVLRSRVQLLGEEPVAVVRPVDEVPVTVVDLRAAPDPEQALREAVAAIAVRPFDLSGECPARAVTYRLGDGLHALALVFHHLAVDAWSLPLLTRDLAACYAARVGAGPAPQPPALQYADVAAWERGRAGGARREQLLQWWRARLEGAPAVLDLPTDRPRPPVADSTGSHVRVDLETPLADGVRALAAAAGATPFMVLLAAWEVLLGQLAAAEDLVVGVVSAGRRHPDVEGVVGCFVDTVPVRADLSGDPTGRELLARVRAEALEAVGHAEVPLEAVLEAVGVDRVPGAHPLFQTLVNVYDEPLGDVALAGLEVEAVEVATPTAKLDLALHLADGGPGAPARGWLVYRTALFDAATAEHLGARLVAVLQGLVAEPDAPVASLAPSRAAGPLLAGPVRAFDDTVPLHALVERWARERPRARAAVGPDGSLDYGDLDRRAQEVAGRLLDRGLAPGEPVGVWVERGVDLVVAMLGVLKAGGAYLPIDPRHPAGRVRTLLEVAGSRFLLTQPALAPGTPPGVTPLLVRDPGPAGTAGPSGRARQARPDVPPDPERTAYVIFTSGSTGVPKGVAVSHRSIVHFVHAVLDRLGEPAAGGRSFALVSTAAADLGLTNVLGALTTGGTLHLVDPDTALDPHALGDYVQAHGVEVIKLVPSHLRLLATHGDLARVLPRRMLVVAGEACPWELVERVRAARPDLPVQSHYGPTETTVSVLACDVDEVPPARRTGTVPLGRPMAGVELHVVDAAGRPLPAGVAGELVIGGPGVAQGYLGRPDLTAERFVPDPATGSGRVYRSGDRVRVGADGIVAFLGRVDDQVKIRGYRVEPAEVTAACRALAGVADAAVLAVEDGEREGKRLVAWLVPEAGRALDEVAAREALRAALPDHLVPSAVLVLAALPLNANGKLDRAALPLPVAAARTPLRTAGERRVAAAWAELLGAGDVGADDDFFALGGDSFTAVRAVRAIDPRLRVVDLFTHPTVAALARHLTELDAAERDGGAPGGLLQRLAGPAPGRTVALRAVCVPYGGGSAAALRPFALALAQARGDVEVFGVELPGHDPARPDEPLLPLPDLLDRCAAEIAALGGPVLVYGHCVGTATAMALALRLEGDGHELAGVVLAASFPAARLPGRLAEWFSRLVPTDRWQSDRSYRDILTVMGGLDDGLDGEHGAVVLRALRHDAREAEEWCSRALADADAPRLRAPVLSVVGERDRTTELYAERHREWGAFAERVELATIPRAGHYFLKHQAAELAGIVSGHLDSWAGGPTSVPLPEATVPVRREGDLRAFALLSTGQFVSMVGSQLSAFAMGVWVFQQTGRLLDFAVLTMLALVPAVVAAPVGGALTDRFDRRRVMLCADLAAALAVGALALQLWLGDLQMWQIWLTVGVGSLATAVQRPAYLAAVAQLVPKPYLPQANALANLGTGVGTLIGPLAGGVLVTSLGLPGVVALDMVSFVVAVTTLLLVRLPDRLFPRREEGFGSAMAGGWRFLARRRPFLVMIAFFVPVNYLLAVTVVVVTPLVLTRSSAATLGVVTAVGGLGAACGALAMVAWGGTRRLAHGMVGFTVVVGLGTVVMGLAPSIPVLAGGLFLFWAGVTILNAHWISIIQVKVGQDLQGRVLSVNQMLATAMMPLGFFSAPVLTDRLAAPLVGSGPPALAAVLTVAGVVLTAWSLAGLAYRPLRRMEDDLPDAVAGAEIADDLDEVQRALDERLAAAR